MLAAGILAAAVAVYPGGASADDAVLLPDTQDARDASIITMTGTFCATGLSVESIEVSLAQPYPKAPIMTFPVDIAAAGLAQTADGFSFTYTVAGDRQFVWFTVQCSDGQRISSRDARVTVWPPYGDLWFVYPYPTPAYGTAGDTIEAVVHSIDCVEGSTGEAELRRGSTLVATGSGVFTDHWLYATIEVPASAPAGEDYRLVVTCAGTKDGDIITDEHPAVIAAGEGPTTTGDGDGLPPTGATTDGLAWVAATLLVLGLIALLTARRRSSIVSEPPAP
jgi:hypothetical protein